MALKVTEVNPCMDAYVSSKYRVIEIFLAGPIQGAPEWHKQCIEYITKQLHDLDLHLILYSPVAKMKPENDEDFNNQMDWETEHLKIASIILFWVPIENNHVMGHGYAQTTRSELGEWRTIDPDKIVLGIETGVQGGRYLKRRAEQTKCTDGKPMTVNTDFVSTMNALCTRIIQEYAADNKSLYSSILNSRIYTLD